MWAFCAGMPRSASTWQYQVVTCLAENRGLGSGLGWVTPRSFPQLRDRFSDDSTLKIVKTHLSSEEMLREVETGQGKVFYTYRDIRDVIVSWLGFQDKSFDEILSRAEQYVFEEHFIWTGQPGAVISLYDDIMGRPSKQITEIAKAMGVCLAEREADRLAEAFSLDQQKRRVKAVRRDPRGIAKRTLCRLLGRPVDYYDKKTQLHWNHISSGKSGRWRQELTQEQCKAIKAKFGQWLIDTGFESTLDW